MIFRKIVPGLESVINGFNSGNLYLDNFLKSPLAYDDSVGKTYLFLSDDQGHVIGYYNIGMGAVEQVQDGTRHKIGGAVHINCFAIDKRFQDQVELVTPQGEKIHLSDLMLYNCMERITTLRKHCIGMAFVTLNATKEGEYFYKNNDFEYLEEDMDFSKEEHDTGCAAMYLPLDLQ